MQPEPLTRRTPDGAIYQRPPEVEAQIASALALPTRVLIERAGGCDPADPTYLREECLVYMIRHYQRTAQKDVVRDLSIALLRRCAKPIHGRLASLGSDLKDDGFSAVVEQLFTRILDLDSDRGDFLQVRFGRALKFLITDMFNNLVRQHQRTQGTIPLSALAGYDAADAEDTLDDVRHRSLDVVPPVAPAHLSPELSALCREALHLLQPSHRNAFVLYHYGGWPIESSDPTVPSLSRYFGKSPRTIRLWLQQAERVLEDWRGENK